jgi:hypothetical protein
MSPWDGCPGCVRLGIPRSMTSRVYGRRSRRNHPGVTGDKPCWRHDLLLTPSCVLGARVWPCSVQLTFCTAGAVTMKGLCEDRTTGKAKRPVTVPPSHLRHNWKAAVDRAGLKGCRLTDLGRLRGKLLEEAKDCSVIRLLGDEAQEDARLLAQALPVLRPDGGRRPQAPPAGGQGLIAELPSPKVGLKKGRRASPVPVWDTILRRGSRDRPLIAVHHPVGRNRRLPVPQPLEEPVA